VIGTGNVMLEVPRTGSFSTLHWDGSQPEEILNLNVGDRQNELYGVAAIAADDAWAVGYYVNWQPGQNYGLHAYVLHWDGTTWMRVDTPAEALDAAVIPHTGKDLGRRAEGGVSVGALQGFDARVGG
jgi:hypothetical protein